jgi:putrescine importer
MSSPTVANTAAAPSLKRALGLWDLVFYGIIVIQPTAPMPGYGVFANASQGQVVTCILIGMVAMVFTAISYGRMARVYPSAGSAYTYVGREIHPALGFVTGWSMTMDYMINPLICTIWCGKAMLDFFPGVSPRWWFIAFGLLFTLLNLRGVETSARINQVLFAAMGVVIVAFFGVTIRYLTSTGPHTAGFFLQPFYNPQAFTPKVLLHGTSLAVLTYIGFDGISTLSEEVHNPKRNILLATVLVCVITGILASAEVYSAQLLRPGYGFSEVEAERAFAHVAAIAGGAAISFAITITLLIATIGSGMGAQLGAARLLYGMGRSNAIPKSFFGALDPRTRIPRNNVIAVGVVALIGAYIIRDYDRAAELLNYGALIAFMGVNIASLTHYFIRGANRSLSNLLVPLCGFIICGALWLNLSKMALIAGSIWMLAGIAYGVFKTRGFRADLVNFDVPSE